jgi:16S rRNA (adenine1518-N6/adenine1519-N6)-dimethyltransferase
MKPETLICNSSNITYDKGYIALWCENYDLPDTIEIEGDTLTKKDHFHVSLLCVKNILEKYPDKEEEIIQHFCNFSQEHEVKFKGFTKEFRLATREERKSVIAMCKVSNLDAFAKYLSQKIGMEVAIQPTHVTIYTLQPSMGIGLNSPEELEEKSEIVEVPESVLAPLMGYKKVIVVDEEDNEIGTEYMMDAIRKGMIRRASRVYVFNESGQILVQQRSKNVLKPLMLDQSAAGHVDIGEKYEQAAHRELQEELGLIDVDLELVETSFRTTDFYNAIYKVTIPDDTDIKYDPEELNAVIWYDTEKLSEDMEAEPDKFTPAFKEAWSLLKNKLI